MVQAAKEKFGRKRPRDKKEVAEVETVKRRKSVSLSSNVVKFHKF